MHKAKFGQVKGKHNFLIIVGDSNTYLTADR